MPLYSYIAKTRGGKKVKEVEEASSQEELIRRLKGKELFIISVKKLTDKKTSASSIGFTAKKKHRRITLFDLGFFARNLSTTLSAGIPLLRSLEIISSQAESLKLGAVTVSIVKEIKKGLSLSEAISKYPKIFSALWRGIIEVGETSGNLPFVLEKLADYLELRLDFERKIKNSLIYPAILVVVSFAAVGVFFKIIMPRFSVIFDDFERKLPLITQVLLDLSNFVNKNFVWIVLIMGALITSFVYLKQQPRFKRLLDKLVLKIPVLNSLCVLTYLERFCSTLYILLDSGVPIVYTLEVTAKGIGNVVMQEAILKIKENVKKGRSLSAELENIAVFPLLMTEVARIGEEAGNLPEMFRKISVHYQKEVSSSVEQMIAMFEPIVIVAMGAVIGTIVIALFLPLISLSTGGGF
ncbi:MAG: type II secretion system F family protein [Candidatus Omnitrophica bacterium]|nr:type II secretion system F family protein [Candidatus Omnitrophota bacterium]